MSADLAGPNGIAFSPDERFLHVTNWDPNAVEAPRRRRNPEQPHLQGPRP